MFLRVIRKKISFLMKELRNLYLRVMGVRVGKNVFISSSAWVDIQRGSITIEDDVRITRGCIVLSHDHSAWITNGGQGIEQETLIKKGAFIGMNSVILPGVTIGEAAVVGAGCVVSKDVPDHTVVVNQGLRIIKKKDPESREWIKVNQKL